jgi:hypothetical protein
MADQSAPGELELRSKLATKLVAVMRSVQYIQKDAENKFHGYRYASEAAIKNAIHSALVDNGLAFFPSFSEVEHFPWSDTRQGKTQYVTRVKVTVVFVDSDTGFASHPIHSYGYGIDGEEKGIYKAVTGALKYALTSFFLIETGDDPELETEEGDRVRGEKPGAKKPAAQPPPPAAKSTPKPPATPAAPVEEILAKDKDAAVAQFEAAHTRLVELAGDKVGPRKFYEIIGKFKAKNGQKVEEPHQFKTRPDANNALVNLGLVIGAMEAAPPRKG